MSSGIKEQLLNFHDSVCELSGTSAGLTGARSHVCIELVGLLGLTELPWDGWCLWTSCSTWSFLIKEARPNCFMFRLGSFPRG